MERKTLPKGVQSFRKIRSGGYYYVDKTAYVDLLAKEGNTNIFLSRPRRFGKSLFVNTLREAFEGNKKLFEGLNLFDTWDWSVKHPVIQLSFGSGHFSNTDGLISTINSRLWHVEKDAGLESSETYPSVRLYKLIVNLYNKTGQETVLLVDEYDKPILDAIANREVATANRDLLASLYGVIKDVPDMVRFSFFTGVSRFAKTSLFSGMNNFEDITVKHKYSSICGYTESDLDDVFAPELFELSRDDIREWYNGYSWLGEEKVYNPYDILGLFEEREFDAWWFKTGMPNFLIDVMRKKNAMSIDLDRMRPRRTLLENFDVDNIELETLLFQTGYLTIAGKEREGGKIRFKLDYPNREVRENLNLLLLEMMMPGESEELLKEGKDLLKYLLECDKDGMKALFQRIFASLPRQWHAPVDLTQYEAYFASSLYSYFMGVGLLTRAEEATNRGRIDLVLEGPSYVYIFELKMVNGEKPGSSMRQIQNREYPQKYRGTKTSVYLVGMEISRETHNIVWFDVKRDDVGES